MSEIEIIEQRLRRFAASPDDQDWPDVLRRAGAASRRRTGPTLAPRRNLRLVLALAGIVVVAAVVAAAALHLGRGSKPMSNGVGQHSRALTGATIQLAGFRFRTPAGFKRSSSTCGAAPSGSGPATPLQRASAAASAEGGCVDGGMLTTVIAYTPPHAEPVAVGSYQGYFLSHPPGDGCHVSPLTPTGCGRDQANAPGMALYVNLPGAASSRHFEYLVLFAQGLTEDQLIAVAQSGLPALPPSTTCTQNCG